MTFYHVTTPTDFEKGGENLINNLIMSMFQKEIYIVVGSLETIVLYIPYLESTNSHYMTRVRWYVPCSDRYPRWSSIFRILSVELWIVLIISIVIAAISTTLVGRYSRTSE